MNLTELLTQITPGPWRPAKTDNDKVVPTVRIFGRRKHDSSKEICFGRIDSVADAHFACHAANVLPELLAAAKNLRENWERNLTEPMARLNEAIAMAENTTQNLASGELTMQMARTVSETIHGNPGERRLLPADTLVALVPASNLPPDSPIKYWAYPVEGHPWPTDTEAWSNDVGVGLLAEDVALVKMRAFPVT